MIEKEKGDSGRQGCHKCTHLIQLNHEVDQLKQMLLDLKEQVEKTVEKTWVSRDELIGAFDRAIKRQEETIKTYGSFANYIEALRSNYSTDVRDTSEQSASQF